MTLGIMFVIVVAGVAFLLWTASRYKQMASDQGPSARRPRSASGPSGASGVPPGAVW